MTALRVLVDATPVPGNRGGVGRYVDSIVPALVRAGVDVTVVAHRCDAQGFASAGASVVVAPASVRRVLMRLMWQQIGLPWLAHRLRPDVVHSVHYTFPLLTRLPQVVTIHDLTFFTSPALHSRSKRTFFRWWLRRIARSGVSVVSISEATATEFRRITGATDVDITVAHLAADPAVFHVAPARDVDRFGTSVGAGALGWIAFLATLEPRKNAAALVRAYATVARRRGTEAMPSLLLAGGDGWDAAVAPAIENARAEGLDVRKLGYLSIDQLAAFLGGAVVFAYPSLGEGFGLPVLEAMASGGCVLTTRELSLPEVGGDAVAYCGTDETSIATELDALLDDAARRGSLREAATLRAATFTWANAAESHASAYRKASGQLL